MKQYFNKENKKLIEFEIVQFINKIEEEIQTSEKSIEEYSDILFIFSELLDQECIDGYTSKIENIIKIVLDEIKLKIKYLSMNAYSDVSMFSSWGSLVFAINNINKKTGDLKSLSQQMNGFIVECLYEYVQDLKNKEIGFYSYDIISGPSGVLYYLLSYTNVVNNKEYRNQLEEVIKYIIYLTKEHEYKGKMVINFHIEKDKQYQEVEKEIMPDGHINFGLAHGMIGTLIALSKTKQLDWKIDGLDEAIHKIVDLYESFKIEEEHNIKFPTQLPLEDYISGEKNKIYDGNASWCYGNISIVRGLMKVYKNTGDDEKYRYYKEKLVEILNQPIQNYHLDTPIVCHGYASPIIIQMSAFNESKDLRFIETIDRNILKLIDNHKELLDKDRVDTDEEKEYGVKYYNDRTLLNGEGGVILTMLFGLGARMNFNKILLVD